MAEPIRPIDQRDSGERLGARGPADLLVMLLLVVGFFLGPIKLLGTSWFGYLSADGLALLVLLVVFAGPLVRSSYRADEQRHAAASGRGAVAY